MSSPDMVNVYTPPSSSCRPINLLSVIGMFIGTAALVLMFCVYMILGRVTIPLTNLYQRRFCRWLLRCTRTSINVEGFENLTPGKAYLFLANHASLMDIPVLLLALPAPVRMVSKQQLVDIPVFGTAMLAAGFVAIDRSNKERAIKQLDTAKQRLAEGVSMCIFPEGTRTKTGELQPFKKGAFHLALDLGVPVVPVYVQGAANVVANKSLRIRYNQTVNVYIGNPISTSHLPKEDLQPLMEATRAEIKNLAKQN